MRDHHMYIIFALLLLVLYCMMNHSRRYSDLEGFGFNSVIKHHGTPTAGNEQLRAYRKNHPPPN
jgi:hypothetical protein